MHGATHLLFVFYLPVIPTYVFCGNSLSLWLDDRAAELLRYNINKDREPRGILLLNVACILNHLSMSLNVMSGITFFSQRSKVISFQTQFMKSYWFGFCAFKWYSLLGSSGTTMTVQGTCNKDVAKSISNDLA